MSRREAREVRLLVAQLMEMAWGDQWICDCSWVQREMGTHAARCRVMSLRYALNEAQRIVVENRRARSLFSPP